MSYDGVKSSFYRALNGLLCKTKGKFDDVVMVQFSCVCVCVGVCVLGRGQYTLSQCVHVCVCVSVCHTNESNAVQTAVFNRSLPNLVRLQRARGPK